MHLLDTNVVSELRKSKTDRIDVHVEAWFETVDPDGLFLSAVTIMELEIGILSMEQRDGRQGAILRAWFRDRVITVFRDRILAVDSDIALICARLNVPDRRSRNDSLIAATALRHDMVLVTRDVADFEGMGVALINPWFD